MNNNTKSVTFCLACASLLFFSVTPAMAHFPWLNMSDYTPAKGAKVKGTIGWGHHYPLDGFLKNDSVESVTVMAPDSSKVETEFTSVLEWETKQGIATEGAYIATSERKPGFYTKTIHGGKSASKKGLEGVLSCSYSHMSMKAIATLGASADVSQKTGLPIEIIPQNNPATLKTGDYLYVQILLDGKPYRGELYGTYAGFSTDNGTFAYVTSTDKEGYGRIRNLHPGIWLLKTKYETQYPDQEECDLEVYGTSLTFEIQ